MTNPTDTAEEAARIDIPSPEHVEHVARAMYDHARATYAKKALPWELAPEHGREVIRQEAALVILSSQEWLEKNGADKEGQDG